MRLQERFKSDYQLKKVSEVAPSSFDDANT